MAKRIKSELARLKEEVDTLRKILTLQVTGGPMPAKRKTRPEPTAAEKLFWSKEKQYCTVCRVTKPVIGLDDEGNYVPRLGWGIVKVRGRTKPQTGSCSACRSALSKFYHKAPRKNRSKYNPA